MIYFVELIGIFFQRPMMLGYNNATIGLFLFLLCIVFSVFVRRNLIIGKSNLNILYICFLFLFINCINNYFLGAGYSAINDFIIGFLCLISLFFVFLNFNKKYNYFFIYILGFIIFSTFITIILSGFNVENFNNLKIFNFKVKDRGEFVVADILFPFSTIPWRMTVGDTILPRATYWTIEPGVGVFIVLLWRYLCRSLEGIKSILCDLIMILGLLATASTTMPLMMLSWFVGRYLIESGVGIHITNSSLNINYKKIFLILFFLLICIYIFLYMPYFGYLNKINTHGGSFDEREDLYSSETGLFRYIRVILLVAFFFLIRRYMCKSFPIIYSAMFFVSILNVFAFTPIFFLSIFLSKKVKDLS